MLRVWQTLLDCGGLAIALVIAFVLRFDAEIPGVMQSRLLVVLPYYVALQYGVLVALGVHRLSWRYVGLREAQRISFALALGAAVILLVRLIAGEIGSRVAITQYAVVPASVVLMDLFLAIAVLLTARGVRRVIAERAETARHRSKTKVESRISLLVGAGAAGVMVARELAARPDLGIAPVGFVDDDAHKVGTVLHGLPVLGTTAEISKIAEEHDVREVLITIANAPGQSIRRIRGLCEDAGLPVKIIPGLYEIVGGQINLSRIREVAIEDLLRREPVQLDDAAIFASLRGRRVLVTGAGGSIGSELCRQVARFGPSHLVLLEHGENALFYIHRELVGEHGQDIEIAPEMADIRDQVRVREVFERHRPEVVFHAAAHKHVPMMEANPGEAIKNNVLGTKVVADVAAELGVEAFVMVSTDKAVNPTSVMGASKRIAEMYIQALSRRGGTRYITVRFGNVLGSAGSVVPIFREQIARGGPVTVTHPEMRRYFMTIPEACQLILQAAAMGRRDEIFILDMGEPVKIVDLAHDLIRLSGLVPEVDIEVAFSGTRPGEKLFEELAVSAENAEKTRHPKILVGRTRSVALDELERTIERLRGLADGGTGEAIRNAIRDAVPEYGPTPSSALPPAAVSERSDASSNEPSALTPAVA